MIKLALCTAAVALTATSAAAGDRWNDPYRHCGYYMTVEWVGDVRIQETRNRCTDHLIEQRVDGPVVTAPQPVRTHRNSQAEALVFGAILGAILAQK